MTAYNTNTATTLAPYNDDLNINTEEKHQLIRIDRKRKAEAQKRKNRIFNIFMGGMLVILSLTVYAATEILGGIDNEAILFITALGGWMATQNERIFNL